MFPDTTEKMVGDEEGNALEETVLLVVFTKVQLVGCSVGAKDGGGMLVFDGAVEGVDVTLNVGKKVDCPNTGDGVGIKVIFATVLFDELVTAPNVVDVVVD